MLDRFFPATWRPVTILGYAAAVAALCAILVIVGFRITSATNEDAAQFDQSAYIQMAGQMKNSWYPWYTDATRNPLFPWLATRFFDPQDPSFFVAGKRFNVLLGALGTAAVGVFFARRMHPLAAFNATALAGLAVLLPISTFFGAEAIFYVLFLFVCAIAMRLLNDNPVWLYAVLGLLAGITWLAKPSATIFLGLFGCFSLLRLVLTRFENLPWALQATEWTARRFFIGVALCGAIYVALISPRLLHAQRTWGSASYSLPSFWFWADDWKTCTEIYYDCRKETLAKLPPEMQPSLSGYFKRHTVGDAVKRAADGTLIRLEQFFHPEGKWVVEKKGKPRRIVLPHRGMYIVGLGALALAMAGFALAGGKLSKLGPIGLPALLWLAAFAAYTLAMGWYFPTGPGHRFIMTLYLPTLWILTQGAEQLRKAADSRIANAIFLSAHTSLCILLVVRLTSLAMGAPFEKVSYAF